MTDHAGPGLHLALPVPQGGEGGHNQEGPWNVAQLALELQRTDGLCSLAQPHLHGMHQLSNCLLAFQISYGVDGGLTGCWNSNVLMDCAVLPSPICMSCISYCILNIL